MHFTKMTILLNSKEYEDLTSLSFLVLINFQFQIVWNDEFEHIKVNKLETKQKKLGFLNFVFTKSMSHINFMCNKYDHSRNVKCNIL